MHHFLLVLMLRLKLALPVVHSQVHQVVVLDLIAVQLLLHLKDSRLLAGKPVERHRYFYFPFYVPRMWLPLFPPISTLKLAPLHSPFPTLKLAPLHSPFPTH